MICPDFDVFAKAFESIDQKKEIEFDKENKLRYNVWNTTGKHLVDMFETLSTKALPREDSGNSVSIFTKLDRAFKRIGANSHKKELETFLDEIIRAEDGTNSITASIALYEVMEAVKGEADAAKNAGVALSDISTHDGVLPAVPTARLAAVIGRKLLFQKGFRVANTKENKVTPEQVEGIYHAAGMVALELLEAKGYANIHNETSTLKSYILEKDQNAPFIGKKKELTVKNTQAVSLNTDKLKILPGSPEAMYFTNRPNVDILGTRLGGIVDILSAARQITQPSKYLLPHTGGRFTDEQYKRNDEPKVKIGDIEHESRKRLEKNPLVVQSSVHSFLKVLNDKVWKDNVPASKIIKDLLGGREELFLSLFGVKNSDEYSVDKRESTRGQNLSKTVAIDDIAEYYKLLMDSNGDPAKLHMALKIGRNERLYYINSVLNAHASKMSRAMLSPGKYDIDASKAAKADPDSDYNYFVYQVGDFLGSKLTYNDITKGSNADLEDSLETFREFNEAKTFQDKFIVLSHLGTKFPGQDFTVILTGLQAVHDIRNAKGGKLTTEFPVSSDATASGGILTFLQAAGSNENIRGFLERIGMVKDKDGNVTVELGVDAYSLLTEAVDAYVNGRKITISMGTRDKETSLKETFTNTLDLLFDNRNKVRDFSKAPTMTFVYGQGESGSIETITTALADRIIDTLDSKETLKYIDLLFGPESKYSGMSASKLKASTGLYIDLKEQLIKSNMPKQVYSLLNVSIHEKFLKEHKNRSTRIWTLVENFAKGKIIKMLPADAVLEGRTAKDVAEYGMPIAKVFEVMHKLPGGTDVLTRKEILHRTVMDVSPIHTIDAALLYHSINDADVKKGMVVVHDQVIGAVEDVRAVEKAYAKKTKVILENYDVHEQMLEALAVYVPNIKDNPEYKELLAEVQKGMEAKKELAKDFNEDTSALIGNGDKHERFVKRARAEDKAEKVDNVSAQQLLGAYAEDSPLITTFINTFDTKVKKGEVGGEDSFSPLEDTITIARNSRSRSDVVAAIEHEIVHAATVAQISEALGSGTTERPTAELQVLRNDVKYFQKAIEELSRFRFKDAAVKDRVKYILNQPGDVAKVAEFVAIMNSEKEVAKAVISKFNGTRAGLEGRIKNFIKRVIDKVATLIDPDKDFNKKVDVDKLMGALQRTLDTGISDRVARQDEVIEILNDIDRNFQFGGATPRLTDIDYLNKAVSRFVIDRAEEPSKRILSGLNRAFYSNSEVYKDVIDKLRGVYNSSEELQAIVHTITGGDVDKEKKAFVLAQFAKITSDRQDFIQHHLGELERLAGDLSDEDKETLEDAITKVPLHEYYVRAKEFNTVESINSAVTALEKDLDSTAIANVDSLVALNVHDEVKGKIYNLESYSAGNDYTDKVHKLLALKSIQAIGTEKFVKLLENTELMDRVQDQVTANHLSLIGAGNKHNLRASGLPHSYAEGIQREVITLEELENFEYTDNSGWEIVSKPTKNKVGLVYRKVIDSTILPGAFTDIKMSSSDIILKPSLRAFSNANSYENVMMTPEGPRMILTEKERVKMGSLGAIQSLVRSTAHAKSIQDSEIIRQEVIKAETRFVVNQKNKKELKEILADDSKENPWFLKADDITYGELPPSVRAKYRPVGRDASDVNKFNEEVTWVRKDIAHWLLGGKKGSLLPGAKFQWMLRITKDLIAMTKINMVLMNPAKIAKDNMSNIAYLGVMGVDPNFIVKNYKNIMQEFGEYTNDKNALLNLKVPLMVDPENKELKAKEKGIRDRLDKNPISSIEDKGFLNSLGSALISRESATLGGTQKDIEDALTYLLKKKDGSKRYIGKLLSGLQNAGYEGEQFFIHLADAAKEMGLGEGAEARLDQIYERLSHIRSQDDVVAYASQFINSPQSEAVRLGASFTDLSDVMAKETYYRYLVDKGESPAKARIAVLDAFPNYVENLPMAVQQASDLGILMFPSFWMRIQKAIYHMARERPLSLATEEMIDAVLGSNLDTILDANIINKMTSWGGVVHSPYENTLTEAVFPTRVMSFNL